MILGTKYLTDKSYYQACGQYNIVADDMFDMHSLFILALT